MSGSFVDFLSGLLALTPFPAQKPSFLYYYTAFPLQISSWYVLQLGGGGGGCGSITLEAYIQLITG